MRVSWDPVKAARNITKHGIAFDEAVTVFEDPLGRVVADPRHSFGEERYALLGTSSQGRLLAVMFTEQEPDDLRIFSARLATPFERRNYEENT